jgi:hypothetical protein
MENAYRLKMKIGDHEFEAEGPVDVVQAQFAAFKEMIANAHNQKLTEPPSEPKEESGTNELPHLPLEKIMKTEGRVVSLTARSETVDEAVLLILLGQKEFRSNQEVTGSEIQDGLKQSGYILPRIDRIMDKHSTDGSVITMGIHRGRRYRLSNQGLAKSLNIAKEVIATVP